MNTTTGKRAVYRPSTSASYHISSGSTIPQHPSAMLRYSELTAISVQLDWDAVVPVTNYIVEYRPSTQPSWSDASRLITTSTMSQLQGLEANTQYIVRVIILNNCDQQVTPKLTFTTGCELLHDTHYVEPEYPQIMNALLHYSDNAIINLCLSCYPNPY